MLESEQRITKNNANKKKFRKCLDNLASYITKFK